MVVKKKKKPNSLFSDWFSSLTTPMDMDIGSNLKAANTTEQNGVLQKDS